VASSRKSLLFAAVAVLLAIAIYAGWRAIDRADDAGPSTTAAGAPAKGGELVALLRSEPANYLRLAEVQGTAAGDLLSLLTDARLVRVNRTTDAVEAWLAESWSESADHLTYTIKLRDDVKFSDGAPFTSADVLFSFDVVYDPRVNSGLAGDMKVAGKPLALEAPDASTVIVRLPSPFAPGLRLLDNLPIVPKHKLQAAFDAGTLAKTWVVGTAPSEKVGLGPFVLREHVSGQRMVFDRNPHYWRKAADGTSLPYLDTLTVLIVSEQNTEALRMEAGEADVMSNADIRPEDFARFKRLADQGRLRLISAGLGLDPNQLWFNLSPSRATDPRNAWMRRREFRQAVSCAVDRQAIANTVYLGEAVPIYGPVTPGNRTWHVTPESPCNNDPARARELLAAAGLSDRNGDGTVEDASGTPAQFSILTQSGHTLRERTAAMIQEQLRKVGLTVDVVGLEVNALGGRWMQGDYDTIYYGVQNSQTDPALTPQFWLSSGFYHFWNPRQPSPATGWERQIDTLFQQQATSADVAERKRLFAEIQGILAEEMPAIYFVAPKVTLAVSSRVVNEQAAPQIPQLLWNAETLAVTGPRR
jgi:peptide/nickel transport system substrate-binding protein